MNVTVDASSKHQDSLPISSDAIMEKLNNWGIEKIGAVRGTLSRL